MSEEVRERECVCVCVCVCEREGGSVPGRVVTAARYPTPLLAKAVETMTAIQYPHQPE